MCREASDTSDAWQDLASPENILALIEIALPVLEQQEKAEVDFRRMGDLLKNDQPSTNPQIDNDGWIVWKGVIDPCEEPVSGIVEVKFKGGETDKGCASKWYWKHDNHDSDIIAYRVIENDGREG